MGTKRLTKLTLLTFLIIFTIACSSSDDNEEFVSPCGPYTDQATSPWVLPYPAGMAFLVTQGNCSNSSHHFNRPVSRHAYDFGMAIGTPLIATRDGVVHAFVEDNPNNTRIGADNNYLQIRHFDNTISEYSHLTTDGVLVEVGDPVSQGDTIALSGNSGLSTGPHLHFVVRNGVGDPTSIPITFSNTTPHPKGLVQGITYPAN